MYWSSVGAELDVVTHGQTYHAMPVYTLLKKNGGIFYFPKKLEGGGIKIAIL
jgi:cytochrome c-type biogenesis protein CcmF